MFRDLRVKLIIFNIGVIGAILTLLALFVYFRSYKTISSQINDEMWQIVSKSNIDDRENHLFINPRSYKNQYNYFRVDKEGNILKNALNESLSQEDLMIIIDMILDANEFTGELYLREGCSYMFLKAKTNKSEDITLVFVNSLRKQDMLINRTNRTISTLILSLILVFLGSLFISKRALIPIKKAWEKQLAFTADASHELRTPLAVIQTNLELIMSNSDETIKSQEKWLENILSENKRMAKLVEDLLTLARSDSHEARLEKSRFMLDDLVKETMIPFMTYAKQEGKSLNTQVDSSIEFFGDRNRIKQLLVILIDNAFKYSPDNAQVSINLASKGKFVELTVCDNGVGIDKIHLDKIFDRFYRVDQARCRNEGSLGLGLSIAKWIVDEHKGTISVKSTPGVGTEFIISLPHKA